MIISHLSYLHICKARKNLHEPAASMRILHQIIFTSIFTPTTFGFASPTASAVARTQETIHMKIHSGAAPVAQSSEFHSDVYIPSFTACRFPEELVYPARSPGVRSQPPPVVSFRSGARKKAASLSMKPFQPLECRRSALLARSPPRHHT